MRKSAFCKCKRQRHIVWPTTQADQHLCFSDLLFFNPKFQDSSHFLRLNRLVWSETHKTGFLIRGLIHVKLPFNDVFSSTKSNSFLWNKTGTIIILGINLVEIISWNIPA